MTACRDLIALVRRYADVRHTATLASSNELLAACDAAEQAERDQTCATCRWWLGEHDGWGGCHSPDVHWFSGDATVARDFGCRFHQPREAA